MLVRVSGPLATTLCLRGGSGPTPPGLTPNQLRLWHELTDELEHILTHLSKKLWRGIPKKPDKYDYNSRLASYVKSNSGSRARAYAKVDKEWNELHPLLIELVERYGRYGELDDIVQWLVVFLRRHKDDVRDIPDEETSGEYSDPDMPNMSMKREGGNRSLKM